VNQRPDIDGWVGIGTTFTPGPERVAALLHEIGHAMGRVPFNLGPNVSELDLMRFVSAGNRLFDGRIPNPQANPPVGPVPAAYFSLDGGVTKLADWGRASDPSDFLNPPASDRTPKIHSMSLLALSACSRPRTSWPRKPSALPARSLS
jgi:hypothetical protein